MTEQEWIILEQGKSLSQSALWQWHQNYYLESGIKAWEKDVPHYITSNTFIANSYAELILNFMTEWAARDPNYFKHPFYLLELGAGHAKFSFYLLKRLFELRKLWPENLQLRYIISDFSEKNLDSCFSHPCFQEYIAEGVLDFAIFDLEKRNPITLRLAQQELCSKDIHNPIIVVANYVLDSIRSDCFYVDDRFRLHESLISIKAKADNLDGGIPKDLQNLNIEYTLKPVGLHHYQNKILDDFLLEYNQQLRDHSFIFPTESFYLIDYLRELSNNKLMMLASDKAYVDTAEFSSNRNPHIAFHGNCLSLMANFDALARYCAIQGGDSYIQPAAPGLSTAVFFDGFSLSDFPKTQHAAVEYCNRFSPQDYFVLYNAAITSHDTSLGLCASMLGLSCYDPCLFNRLLPMLNKLVPQAGESLKATLMRSAHLVAKQFYYLPYANDTYFDVGLFMHTVNEYKTALAYYQKSEQHFGPRFNSFYNLGLCHYHLSSWDEAELYFCKALELQADAKAKEWLGYVRKKLKCSS